MDDNCQEEKAQTENSESSESDGCSPFFVCSTCIGFTISETPLTFTNESQLVINHEPKKYPEYTQHFYSQFCSSIWQPPKLG